MHCAKVEVIKNGALQVQNLLKGISKESSQESSVLSTPQFIPFSLSQEASPASSPKFIPFILSNAGGSSHDDEVPHLSNSPLETLSDVSCDLNFPAIKQFRDVLTDYVEDDSIESVANEILHNKELREQLRDYSEK